MILIVQNHNFYFKIGVTFQQLRCFFKLFNYLTILFTALDRNSSPSRLEKFKNTETGRTSEVKGFQNEQKVVNPLVKYSQLKNLGLKIFPGVKVDYKKANALSAALKSENIKNVKTMEIDIVAIGKSAIYLFETKSSIGEVLVSLIKSIMVALKSQKLLNSEFHISF